MITARSSFESSGTSSVTRLAPPHPSAHQRRPDNGNGLEGLSGRATGLRELQALAVHYLEQRLHPWAG